MASFECAKCDKAYKNRRDIIAHQRMHDGTAFACEFCERRFDTNTNLKRHRIAHTIARPYACDVDGCEKKFKSKDYVKSHKRTVHEKVPGKHRCEQCPDRTFNKLNKLKKHRRIHSGERPYACTECAMKFKEKYHLQEHYRRKHTDERYACDVGECAKKFTSKSSARKHKLKMHENSHT